MRKRFLLALLAGGCFSLSAQNDTISNGGFETWDTLNYVQPRGWYTLNDLQAFGYPATAELTTDAHSGKYAIKLESKTSASGDLNGVIASGPLLTQSGTPDLNKLKYKFTSQPQKLRFYYKASPMTGDSCAIVMFLTKWNASSHQADTVARAGAKFGQTQHTYTLYEATFNYLLPMQPDSAIILAASSMDGFNPVVGSVFYLDDVSLVYANSGIADVVSPTSLHVYPNPVNDRLYLDAKGDVNVIVYDVTGHKVQDATLRPGDALPVENCREGVYHLLWNDGTRRGYDKIVVKH